MDRGRLIKDGTRFFGFDNDENPRPSISQCAANHIFPVGASDVDLQDPCRRQWALTSWPSYLHTFCQQSAAKNFQEEP